MAKSKPTPAGGRGPRNFPSLAPPSRAACLFCRDRRPAKPVWTRSPARRGLVSANRFLCRTSAAIGTFAGMDPARLNLDGA
jgi:hypothetical protein